MIELIPGVTKEDYSDYVLYFIESLTEELKQEIRNRLVAVCHGVDQARSGRKIYSYKATVKEFIKRYKTSKNVSEERKKGMIGELLVHVILEMEGRFTTASPFFNMEERSFKKGYDVALFENKTNSLWITEVKSGEIQKGQKNASAAAIGLINTAKNDLKSRLNASNTSLWLNALNAAKVSMSDSNHQKDAVMKLLEQCADDSLEGNNSSDTFNVVLSATLFHPMSERIKATKVGQKYIRVVNENLFKKVYILIIQKETFEAVYNFLERETVDEK
ncbi:DUF1837 domain-containing protein [Drancourtella massiliensis]|uniref:Anti-bacteriophage protein A/HamA C-terminal domain-containing protein n=2 Tax=Clostridia TaxID=186801 RepID=A0A9W6FIA5_9FIRM|nr:MULTISPECIES: Hachiman antiphage defense system protein HamA [Clostridia]MBM6745366.1 DUF1837 domain-containing protein [Drancourtella massiliensis]OUN67570.1 hypothetical protein B5G11_15950 [Drancourtella sp. An57]GLG90653.1 hypothetical protein Selli2_20800 [Sellimonas catena]